jgi:hypothetical protein
MINPQMNDWWSHKRLTNLKYFKTSLSGAGVSRQVLVQALNVDDVVWFSKIFGECNDNLISVAVDSKTANSFALQKFDELETKSAFFGKTWNNEYKLTNEIEEMIGLSITPQDLEIKNSDRILFWISSHDNFCFCIEPISDEILRNVIKAILKQHSFYLGQEINWEKVEPQIIYLLKEYGEIDLQSDPKRKCVWIPQIEPKENWIIKKFRKGSIIIDGSEAKFSKRKM